ncbi:macro domain-containing protein [Prevotella sp. PINT]|jgi:Predicted phosphatase homologous to the C-terminal domain of histone macroH2A1|uniref:macro domain-containing protein n=1 Tax=Palleniella intestinalis TaxID=2736291 RepID=UPI0015571C7C|nr:macro domain-containing protein [Palleniella intestinalis]NPD80804.1 macro domain-containing protein [Palleniella intestinalis]
MVRYIKEGDIFTLSNMYSFAHGCNCAGAMGKGIALQFREKYQDMYAQYRNMCKENLFKPGDVFDFYYGEGHIYNLATQKTWRSKARIEYIEQALTKMLELAERDGVKRIAMPAIGAGLGGLLWKDVKITIDKIAGSHQHIELVVVESFAPQLSLHQ